MTLKEAVAIISRNARLYQTELCEKQLLFLYRDGNNNVDYIEAVFRTNNYIIAYTARMIGNYAGPRMDLYTEKIAGTTSACLGMIKRKSDYVPNTVLSEDIRNIVPHPPGKIFAIFRKSIKDDLYRELTYQQSRDIAITKKCIPDDIMQRIDPDCLKNDNI